MEQSTLMYCISSMSWTSTLSSGHTVSSCSLRRPDTRQDGAGDLRRKDGAEEHLVEMRLKTALKLLQLREKRTAEAEARSSAACWWPSRYVWMKWQISGSSCLTSMVSSRRRQSLDC